jgi:ABC-2 type transport system permease protein
MTQDILTVMWKERKGMFRLQGSRTRTLLSLLVAVLMIAVAMPIQMGRDWVEDAWSLLVAIIIPLLLIGIMIPESFAGERERHTLETLLASRLPDRAILFGKLALAVAFGWLITLLILLLSLIPVNALYWSGRIMVYQPDIALANVVVSLLMSGLVASLGVLISLRSATTQGAQQTLMLLLMLPIVVLQIGPMLMLSLVPDGEAILKQWLSVDLAYIMLVLVGILLVADAGLLLAAMARFRRARLILD